MAGASLSSAERSVNREPESESAIEKIMFKYIFILVSLSRAIRKRSGNSFSSQNHSVFGNMMNSFSQLEIQIPDAVPPNDQQIGGKIVSLKT